MVLLLSRSDIMSLLSMSDVIEAVETGFRMLEPEEDHIPVRLPVQVKDQSAVVLFMPAYLAAQGTLGAKTVSVYPNNPAKELPAITGYYTLCEAETGMVMAIMDATYLTGIRTAAASAVATKYLAVKDSSRLGIIGAGVQARFHVEAMMTVRPISEIMVANRSRERGEQFIQTLREKYDVPVHFARTANECAAAADILVTCTSADDPLFDGEVLKAGTHINAVGAYTPEMRELDSHTIKNARVFVDTYEGAFEEAGDILIPIQEGDITRAHVQAELTELVRCTSVGRLRDEDITVFKSVGYAMEDAVTARLAYQKAVESGFGLNFDFDA